MCLRPVCVWLQIKLCEVYANSTSKPNTTKLSKVEGHVLENKNTCDWAINDVTPKRCRLLFLLFVVLWLNLFVQYRSSMWHFFPLNNDMIVLFQPEVKIYQFKCTLWTTLSRKQCRIYCVLYCFFMEMINALNAFIFIGNRCGI